MLYGTTVVTLAMLQCITKLTTYYYNIFSPDVSPRVSNITKESVKLE